MPLTAEQLALRKTAIFATEISALTGHNPYRGPWDVFADKRPDLVQELLTTAPTPAPLGQSRSLAAELGDLLEPVVLELYTRRTGATLTYPGSIKHPTLPIGATPDAIADGRTVVEAKTRNPWHMAEFGEAGTDEVPSHYFLQTQMQMHLTGLPETQMPVLFGFNEFRIYTIKYDAELTARLVDIACKFWRDHVETGIPPPVDASPACMEWLTRRHPRPVRPVRQADSETVTLAKRIQKLDSLSRQCWQNLEQAKNEMRALIGDAYGVEGPGFRVSWKVDKNQRRSLRFSWE